LGRAAWHTSLAPCAPPSSKPNPNGVAGNSTLSTPTWSSPVQLGVSPSLTLGEPHLGWAWSSSSVQLCPAPPPPIGFPSALVSTFPMSPANRVFLRRLADWVPLFPAWIPSASLGPFSHTRFSTSTKAPILPRLAQRRPSRERPLRPLEGSARSTAVALVRAMASMAWLG